VVARRGSGALLRVLAVAAPLTVVLPALAVDAASLGLLLLAVGAANGALDIAMNAQGVAVERAAGRRLFTSLHAAFSFGALAGAATAGLAAAAGLDPLVNLAVTAGAGGLAGAVAARGLIDDPGRPQAPLLARPTPPLTALAVLAFCALLAEGSVFDWSGIYLADVLGAPGGTAALGLAAFSLTMGFGRLGGDGLNARFGAPAVVRAGALLAALGLGLAVAASAAGVALAGFAAMGLGLSVVFPLALRAAGDVGGAGPGLAAVSTVGYAGFLTGPPAIGLIAEGGGLRLALGLVAALVLAAAALSGHARTASGRRAERG